MERGVTNVGKVTKVHSFASRNHDDYVATKASSSFVLNWIRTKGKNHLKCLYVVYSYA